MGGGHLKFLGHTEYYVLLFIYIFCSLQVLRTFFIKDVLIARKSSHTYRCSKYPDQKPACLLSSQMLFFHFLVGNCMKYVKNENTIFREMLPFLKTLCPTSLRILGKNSVFVNLTILLDKLDPEMACSKQRYFLIFFMSNCLV